MNIDDIMDRPGDLALVADGLSALAYFEQDVERWHLEQQQHEEAERARARLNRAHEIEHRLRIHLTADPGQLALPIHLTNGGAR